MLGRETEGGFRGVQSKSLMDIIQLECISQSSSVLRITNGPLTGKIWIQDGELIDAEAGDLRGEPAFQKILSWKAGNFEMLPAEPSRPRTIFKSYNALLLESAQALDESRGGVTRRRRAAPAASPLAQVSQVEGVEFVLAMKAGEGGHQVARGLGEPGAHGRVGAAEPGTVPRAGRSACAPDRSNKSRALARSATSRWPARAKPSFVSAGSIRWPRTRSGK